MLHNPHKDEGYHQSVVGSDNPNPVPEERPSVIIDIDTKRFHEVEVTTSGDIRDEGKEYSAKVLRKYFEEVLGDVVDLSGKVFREKGSERKVRLEITGKITIREY